MLVGLACGPRVGEEEADGPIAAGGVVRHRRVRVVAHAVHEDAHHILRIVFKHKLTTMQIPFPGIPNKNVLIPFRPPNAGVGTRCKRFFEIVEFS